MPLNQLHFEHSLWSNELSFYKDELKLLNNYLEEIASKNTKHDVMVEVEQFQNRFIRQKEVLDTLLHDINEHEQLVLHAFQNLNPIQATKSKFEDHAALRESIDTFKKLYAELKLEFFKFLNRRM